MRTPKPLYTKKELPKEDKEAIQELLNTAGWEALQRMLYEEINIAITANMRVGAEHDYYIGVTDGISVIFNVVASALDEEIPTDHEIVTRVDPATSGWMPQFRALCQHPLTYSVQDPIKMVTKYSCRSCKATWEVNDADKVQQREKS